MFGREFSLAVLGLVLGAMAGLVFPGTSLKVRSLASEVGGASPINVSYDHLPCLSDSTFSLWSKKLNIPDLEKPHCEDPVWGKVSRLISLSERIRPDFPPGFAPSLQQDLRDPFWYLHKHSQRLGVDLNQMTSVAYNRAEEGGRSVYLGGMFLDDHPLDALSTVIHEARHSLPSDPGHTVCTLGNIPRTRGGCDYEFSLDSSTAGAYSFGVAYQAGLALYGRSLGREDRERLALNALAELSTRFNNLPLSLAERFDLLAILNSDGQISWVHPFFSEPLPGPKAAAEDDPWERLDFLVMNNGAIAYGKKGTITGVLPNKAPERAFAQWIQEPVLAWSRVLVPFDDYSYNTFYLRKGDLKILRYFPEVRQRKLAPFPNPFGDSVGAAIPVSLRFFTGLVDETYYLDEDGRVALSRKFGNERPWRYLPELQGTHPWREGHGGVLSDQLFLVDSEGAVFRGGVLFGEGGADGSEPEIQLTLTSGDMPFVGPVKKLVEGLHGRAMLMKDGSVSLFSFEDELVRQLEFNEPILDVTLVRPHLSKAVLSTSPDQSLAESCGLLRTALDPWTGGVLGLYANGSLGLAWKSPKGEVVCRRENRWGPLKGFKIVWEAESQSTTFQKRPLPSLQLELERGKFMRILPYARD
jgi:hypothetical protein